jgi:rod shape determining protein RodA
MVSQKNVLSNTDWILVALYLAFVFMGWLNIYAAVYNENHKSIFDLSQAYGKQLIWIGTAFIIALAILITDQKFFTAFAYPIFGVSLLILLIVLIFGKEVAGSRSWFRIGDFAVQPSEFVKFSTALVLAKYLGTVNIRIQDFKSKIYAFAIILIPVSLILLQNDTGSAMVFIAFIFVLYREGLSGNVLIFGLLICVLFFLPLLFDKLIIIAVLVGIGLILLYLVRKNKKDIFALVTIVILSIGFIYSVDHIYNKTLKPHQKQRIDVLIGKQIDLKGAGYNVNQSKIAIGSGGLIGKGFLQGTQTKYDFVPKQSTDFIFSTIGEEWGFLGSSFVILLFILFFFRILFVAERQRSAMNRIYGYGVASLFFIHFMINIGMTIGFFPVVGIPLPFFSYGGSSLWAFTLLLFVLIKFDSNRLYAY